MEVWVLHTEDRYSGAEGCLGPHWTLRGIYATREAGMAEAERLMNTYTREPPKWEIDEDFAYAHDRAMTIELLRESVQE